MSFNGSAFGAAKTLISQYASGYDHSTKTGDNTFDIYFTDGSKISITIPGISTSDLDAIFNARVYVTDEEPSSTDNFVLAIEDDGEDEDAEEYLTKSEVEDYIDTEIDGVKSELVGADANANAETILPIKNQIVAMSNYVVGTQNEISITIPNAADTTITDATLVLNLHNEDITENQSAVDLYSSLLPKNFEGIKFFDGTTELPFEVLNVGNYSIRKNRTFISSSKPILMTSDGWYIADGGSTKKIRITKNNGTSWTQIMSGDRYELTFIDSNDNVYAFNETNHSLYRYVKSDEYAVGTMVCDMSSVSATHAYAFAELPNGYLFVGNYQEDWNGANLYRSVDGGLTWNIIKTRTDKQHSHSLSVDKTNNIIYWGIDDSSSDYGPACMRSTDNGETWEEVPIPFRNRDYFVYHAENFDIGGGECNILGGVTLYKTNNAMNSSSYYKVLDTNQGIRKIVSIDGDKVLICGGCAGGTNQTRQLYLSEDYGETWKTIWESAPETTTSAGNGFRYSTPSANGIVVLSGFGDSYGTVFNYNSDKQSALLHINVGDIPSGGKTITLKSGYLCNSIYEDKALDKQPIFKLMLSNDGIIEELSQKKVNANLTKVSDKIPNSNIADGKTKDFYLYGLADNAEYNLGKFRRLNFNKGFTVTMWIKPNMYPTMMADTTKKLIARVGNYRFFTYKNQVHFAPNTSSLSHYVIMDTASAFMDKPIFVAFTFSNATNPIMTAYSFDKTVGTKTFTSWSADLLSANDLIIGGGTDYAKPYPFNDLRIYNEVLSVDDIRAIWHNEKLK